MNYLPPGYPKLGLGIIILTRDINGGSTALSSQELEGTINQGLISLHASEKPVMQ